MQVPWNDMLAILFVLIQRWEEILDGDELISKWFGVTSTFDKNGNYS